MATIGCNSCNRCITCETCNDCLTCEACNGPSDGCLNCQGYCESNQWVCEQVKENGILTCGTKVFGWGSCENGECAASGEYIFSRNTWNKIINYINDARKNAADKKGMPTTQLYLDYNNYLTAEKFNQVSRALFESPYLTNALEEEVSPQIVNVGDTVYGSYFEDLAIRANNLKYVSSACKDQCDAGCNNCNICQGCNNCQTGNICIILNKCLIEC